MLYKTLEKDSQKLIYLCLQTNSNYGEDTT